MEGSEVDVTISPDGIVALARKQVSDVGHVSRLSLPTRLAEAERSSSAFTAPVDFDVNLKRLQHGLYSTGLWSPAVTAMALFLLAAAVSVLTIFIFEVRAQSSFSWSDITPSKSLIWLECFPGFQCARLNVPLDYANPDASSAALALIRVPANVSADDPSYRGPIIFNPGGPGESGVDFVLNFGSNFAQFLGPEYDIVSFDPRGVALSTPGVSFYESNLERTLWDDFPGAVDLNSSEDAVGRAWAKNRVTNTLAAERAADVLPFMTTEYVARDMMTIVEAHGREKLLYWGISYGTVLGATFATLFPDNVERLVLDGVLDSDFYYSTEWNNLNDTDEAIGFFFSTCSDAGPDACPFWAESPSAIRQNLDSLYELVRTQPVPVFPRNGSAVSYGVIDYNALKQAVFSSLSTPYQLWSFLAAGLAALTEGDGAPLFDTFQAASANETYSTSCEAPDPEFTAGREVWTAFVCNDGIEIPNTWEDTQAQFQRSISLSEFGGIGAAVRIGCSGWPQLAPNAFRGPVGANTSFPILFVGNEADPVTPHVSAVKMSSRFPGSVVLSQNFTGHVSIAAPSACTSGYIRAYFVNGTLPEPDVWCPVDSLPFDDTSSLAVRNRIPKRSWIL